MANRLYNKQVSPKGYQEGGKVKKKKSIIQSIIDIPKTIRSNNAAIKKISKKMAEEKRFKDKMSKAESKAFSESLKQPRKRERLDDKIKENAKKVAMMRATGQIWLLNYVQEVRPQQKENSRYIRQHTRTRMPARSVRVRSKIHLV